MKAKIKLGRKYWSKGNSLIEAKNFTVFIIYERDLLWEHLLSYTWGITDKRIKIPIKNERKRQTYYGALDDQTKEFILQELKKLKY